MSALAVPEPGYQSLEDEAGPGLACLAAVPASDAAIGDASASPANRLPEPILRAAGEAAGVGVDVLERAVVFALTRPAETGWRTDASCRDGNANDFYPSRVTREYMQLVERCRACPVQSECLGSALADGEMQGLWGATSAAGRRRLRGVLRHTGLFGVVGEDACESWREEGASREPSQQPSRVDRVVVARRHQLEALDAICASIAGGGRCQIAGPPGSGKTHIGMWAAARLDARRVLILVPTLGIIPQTVRLWRRDGPWPEATFLAVCGDSARGLELETTGDAGRVQSFLAASSPVGPSVVVATYQSSSVLVSAGERFDLVIADEAHHLAGGRTKPFAAVVRGEIPAARILFMTATPRSQAAGRDDRHVVGMDDVATFGPRVHRLSLDDAVQEGIVADYRVVIAAVDRATFEAVAARTELARIDPTLLAGAIAVRSMGEFGLGSCLSFHSRVDRARSFAELVGAVAEALPAARPPAPGWSGWVRGATAVGIRQRLLDRLADPATWGVLASARAFGEGIDVPTLDSVAIVDVKNSEADVIQAVGRALRRPGGSAKIGTVVLPVLLAGAADPDDPMAGVDEASLKVVAGVLRALRAHDESLACRLDATRRVMGRSAARPGAGAFVRRQAAWGLLRSRVELWVPGGATGALAGAMALRLVREATPTWEENYGRLRSWIEAHGSARMPRDLTVDDGAGGTVALASWAVYQRTLRRRGLLSVERQDALERLPGWLWEPNDERWWEGFDALADWVAKTGDTNPGKDVVWQDKAIGALVYTTRLAHRAGAVAADRAAAFERLPGWCWDPPSDLWSARLDALVRWSGEHGHARPGRDVVGDDGFELGRWVDHQRVAVRAGRLDASRAARLAGLPGWTVGERAAPWEAAYARLAAWAAEHGGHDGQPHLDTGGLVDLGLADGSRAGDWVAAQCRQYLEGRLHPARAARLEAIAGWVWPAAPSRGGRADAAVPCAQPVPRAGSVPRSTSRNAGDYRVVFAEPPPPQRQPASGYVAPDSQRDHGSYVKYVVEQCRCPSCKRANREYENRRQAAMRDPAQTWVPYVPAGPARRHLEELAAAGVGRKQVARVSGVPHGSLCKLIFGDPARGLAPSKRIRKSTADRILAVTADDLAGGARVPAGPVWQLMDELVAAGYTKSWIAGQLGRAPSNVSRRNPQVTAAMARAVGELHRQNINKQPPSPKTRWKR